MTPLLLAAMEGHNSVVKWLVQKGGASVRDEDKYGCTALMLAIKYLHLGVIHWLLKDGSSLGESFYMCRPFQG
jgi:ankyrin repeat protein